MHRVEAEIVRRGIGVEGGDELLVAVKNAPVVGKEIAMVKRAEGLTGDVRAEGEGDFATGENIQGVEAEIRDWREGSDRSEEVTIAFDNAAGGRNQVAALDVAGRWRAGGGGKAGRGGKPYFTQWRGGEAQGVKSGGGAIGL